MNDLGTATVEIRDEPEVDGINILINCRCKHEADVFLLFNETLQRYLYWTRGFKYFYDTPTYQYFAGWHSIRCIVQSRRVRIKDKKILPCEFSVNKNDFEGGV